MRKPLREGGEAILPVSPGVPLVAGVEREWQTFDRIELSSGLTLGEIDAVTCSELPLDLQRLAEQA